MGQVKMYRLHPKYVRLSEALAKLKGTRYLYKVTEPAWGTKYVVYLKDLTGEYKGKIYSHEESSMANMNQWVSETNKYATVKSQYVPITEYFIVDKYFMKRVREGKIVVEQLEPIKGKITVKKEVVKPPPEKPPKAPPKPLPPPPKIEKPPPIEPKLSGVKHIYKAIYRDGSKVYLIVMQCTEGKNTGKLILLTKPARSSLDNWIAQSKFILPVKYRYATIQEFMKESPGLVEEMERGDVRIIQLEPTEGEIIIEKKIPPKPPVEKKPEVPKPLPPYIRGTEYKYKLLKHGEYINSTFKRYEYPEIKYGVFLYGVDGKLKGRCISLVHNTIEDNDVMINRLRRNPGKRQTSWKFITFKTWVDLLPHKKGSKFKDEIAKGHIEIIQIRPEPAKVKVKPKPKPFWELLTEVFRK